jgi:hypothetical protein
MATKLNSSTTVHVLAADLGLKPSSTPVQDIVSFCQRKVKQFLGDFKDCTKPSQLLSLAANKLGTTLIEVHSNADMQWVVKEYVERGELASATLAEELTDDVFGLTLKLVHAGRFDLPYVSIIDCRGSKARRAYFTKWHELGHLLILTDQRRLTFRRTHSLHESKSPEESLVDVLAGEFAYYAPMVRPLAKGQISFAAIQAIRDELCPDGSFTSAMIGVAKAWPRPCILVEARLGWKKGDGDPSQGTLGFTEAPVAELRAVNVAINEPARKLQVKITAVRLKIEQNQLVRVTD